MRIEIFAWASYILVVATMTIQLIFQNLPLWVGIIAIIVSLFLRIAASKEGRK